MTLGIFSDVTERFSNRIFALTPDGYLTWRRPTGTATKTVRKIFIANEISCDLRNIKAVDKTDEKDASNRYQLSLQTKDDSVVIGMPDEATLLKWLKSITNIVEGAAHQYSYLALVIIILNRMGI
jgi:hypothetical protein